MFTPTAVPSQVVMPNHRFMPTLKREVSETITSSLTPLPFMSFSWNARRAAVKESRSVGISILRVSSQSLRMQIAMLVPVSSPFSWLIWMRGIHQKLPSVSDSN